MDILKLQALKTETETETEADATAALITTIRITDM